MVDCEIQNTIEPEAGKDRRSTTIILIGLLLLAAAFRLPRLQSPGYGLDELWILEIASGRGSPHLDLPVNRILSAPELLGLTHAPPVWQIWTHMQITHPPLYFLLLRLWIEVAGSGDFSPRALSVLFSLSAIALLFDTARMLNGRPVAIWACLLMIVASPQVDLARKVRDYTFTYMTLLAVANLLVRIEKFGMTRRRWIGLAGAVTAAALSHYFCLGTLIGFGLYVMIRQRGRVRWHTLAAFASAALLCIFIWGPFFLQQRTMFSVDDPATQFLRDLQPAHGLRVLRLFLMVPATLLVARVHLNGAACLLGALYVTPFLMLRRRKDLLLWALWMLCSAGIVALLDLTRSTIQMGFVRYVSLASPGLFVLLGASCTEKKLGWFKHAIPAVAVLASLFFVSDAYQNPAADPIDISNHLKGKISPEDIVIFASPPELGWTRGCQYLMVERYFRPLACPVLFLDAPMTKDLFEKVSHRRGAFVFSSGADPSYFLPGFVKRDAVPLPAWGDLTLMVPPGAVNAGSTQRANALH